jgi:hypothetical protein
MTANWGKDYPITSMDILKRVYTQYPYFHKGLEIECKDGQRIATARKRGLRLFGYSMGEYRTAWQLLGVDPYCTKGESLDDLPYENGMFDLVIVPFAMDYVNLDEIYRVGNRMFYMKLKPNGTDWLDKILKKQWKIEVYQISNIGNMILECRK